MLKKLSCLLLVITILSVLSVTVFAEPTDGSAADLTVSTDTAQVESVKSLIDEDSKDTDQNLITITRPDRERDATYKRSYVISGVSDFEDVRVILEVYDKKERTYVPMKNTDGESWWDVGSFGVFSKEIKLSKGANKIRILAYRTSQDIDIDKIQRNTFTVTLLNESIKDVIINSVVDFTKNLENLFQP